MQSLMKQTPSLGTDMRLTYGKITGFQKCIESVCKHGTYSLKVDLCLKIKHWFG